MPLPLIPLIIKGAFVAAKAIAAKGAAAKVTYAAAHTVKAVGVTKALVGAAAVLAVIGGVEWTMENIDRAKKAHKAAKEGRLLKAAQHLIEIAGSVHSAYTNDLAGELTAWRAAGYPANRRVISLARSAHEAAKLAKRSR